MLAELSTRNFELLAGFALAATLVQTFSILDERFAVVPSGFSAAVALASMLLTFTLWGIAAGSVRRAGASVFPSILAGSVCAAISMSFAVCFGILLELYLAPYPLASMRFWPEFQRSGGTDLGAFAIANTLDSASSHLALGPIVGAICGAIGTFAARFPSRTVISVP